MHAGNNALYLGLGLSTVRRQAIMRKFGESMRQLSKTFSDEGEQLLHPDETPEDFGVSLSQLRHLAEVRLPFCLAHCVVVMVNAF